MSTTVYDKKIIKYRQGKQQKWSEEDMQPPKYYQNIQWK